LTEEHLPCILLSFRDRPFESQREVSTRYFSTRESLDSRSLDLETSRLGRPCLENPSLTEPFKRPCLWNPIDVGGLEIHLSKTYSTLVEGSLELGVLDFKTLSLEVPSAEYGNSGPKIPRHEIPNRRKIVLRSPRLQRPRLESLPRALNSRDLHLRAP